MGDVVAVAGDDPSGRAAGPIQGAGSAGLKVGQVFESLSPATEDVPVKVGQCSWAGVSSRCWNSEWLCV